MPIKLILWDFSTSILSQNSKKIEGGLFSLTGYCMLRGKKIFLVQFSFFNFIVMLREVNSTEILNKPETAKIGAISKAQKA